MKFEHTTNNAPALDTAPATVASATHTTPALDSGTDAAPVTSEYLTPPATLPDLTAWAERNACDLLILNGGDSAGTLVYQPPANGNEGVLIRVTGNMPAVQRVRRELEQANVDAPQAV